MNQFTIVAAIGLLCSIAAPLAIAQEHDDLEGTMQVFDGPSDVDRNAESLGPPRARGDSDDDASDHDSDQELRDARSMKDNFEHDDMGDDDRVRTIQTEHEIEDGEEVDYDQYDIVADDIA